jgi:thiol-disulfide isomerase/thioredoxin
LLVTCTSAKKEKVLEKESDTPALYVNLKGENVYLKDYLGSRIVVNYWATWCTPCLQEMPSLVNAQEILKNENYTFLFPSTDKIEKIASFNKAKNYPLQFLHYTSTLDKINVYALPATMIYGTKGELIKRIDGATEWDSEETINLLKSIE